MGAIDGHYSLNPRGIADVGQTEVPRDEVFKTGWTGNSEEAIGELTEAELESWDELDKSGHYTDPPSRSDDAEDE